MPAVNLILSLFCTRKFTTTVMNQQIILYSFEFYHLIYSHDIRKRDHLPKCRNFSLKTRFLANTESEKNIVYYIKHLPELRH